MPTVEPTSAPATEPFVRCDHLVKFFDTASGRVQAVRGVDLELYRGTVSAIVGPSGSGKSSLLRMLSGLERPTAGLVLLDGVDLWQLGERARARRRARLLTHVEQRPDDNLFAHLPAVSQLRRMAPAGSDAAALADEWLSLLGLEARATSLPAVLSGGERQRLAFARAAVAGHGLVIADEPTSQLDARSTASVLDAVDLLAARGVTVLLATHDRRVLERVHDVIALRDGAVATVTSGGTPLSVIDRSGRLQLPPELLERFPDRRVVIRPDGDHIRLESP